MRSLAVLCILVATPAWAQSKRYPAGPADDDREAEVHSRVWEQALMPSRAPYEALVKDAAPMVENNEPVNVERLKSAIAKLDQAVAKLPTAFEAYVFRGEAYLKLAKETRAPELWGHCADDLTAADARIGDAPGDRTELHLWLGLCAARAGRLSVAEEVLARTAAIATVRVGELYTRLGEVRIALGKLDEAIDALGVALERNDYLPALDHWLIAAAYDRSRRNADALEHLQMAIRIDSTLSSIANAVYPLVGAGEDEYLLALTYPIAGPPGVKWQPSPERAILYFRQFLKVAPSSPWRRRAEEHLRELTTLDLPQFFDRATSSTALVDTDAARAVLHKSIPAMRACLAKLPAVLFEVSITKTGPHQADARDRPRFGSGPPEGARSVPFPLENTANVDLDAAQACIDRLARAVPLPAPKEHDTYYVLRFQVISP